MGETTSVSDYLLKCNHLYQKRMGIQLPNPSVCLPRVGVGKALTELGKVYLEQDYRIKGLSAFERSYKIHKEFYGEKGHPEVSRAYM